MTEHSTCFNPHPPAWAGDTLHFRETVIGSCFNPHPPAWAGDTVQKLPSQTDAVSIHTRPRGRVTPCLLEIQLADLVSIHTRPRGRVTSTGKVDAWLHLVSIHTRPRGRVTLHTRLTRRGSRSFNPHPPAWAGDVTIGGVMSSACGFNPHPPAWAGDALPRPTCGARQAFQSTPARVGG